MWMGLRIALVAGVAHAVLATSAATVRADAFVARPGEGKIIVLSTFDRAGQYWTREGRLIPVSSYAKFNFSAFTEYGLDDRTTLVARSEAGLLSEASGMKTQGAGGLGARRLLFETGAVRVAAQAMVSAGSGLEGMPDRAMGAALDTRLATAVTFTLMQRPAFVEISGGSRVVVGDWRGVRLDAAFGVRPAEKWLALLQSFNRFNEEGAFGSRVRAHKAQASVIYDFRRQWSVIAGAFTTLSARAERRQHGALMGVMHSF